MLMMYLPSLENSRQTVSEWTEQTNAHEAAPNFPYNVVQSPTSPQSVKHGSSAPSSRILGLGTLAALGSKGSKLSVSRDDALENAHASNNTTEALQVGSSITHDWDFIDVTEVSAKDNEGIEDVFVGIATRLVERREELEAQAEARHRQERTSIFLNDEHPGEHVSQDARSNDTVYQSNWCCSG